MSAFEVASEVEQQSIGILLPILMRSFNGKVFDTKNHSHSRELQRVCGDFFALRADNRANADVIGLEIKAEKRHTGNLFIETWSNRKLGNPGWLWKSKADYILYHFLDKNICYVINMRCLKKFCHETPVGKSGKPGRLEDYKEIQQSKYDQKNDTWGRLIPVEDLQQSGCLRVFMDDSGTQFKF